MKRWGFVRFFDVETGAGTGEPPLNSLEVAGVVAAAEEAAEEVATEIVHEAEVDQWQTMNSLMTEMESRLSITMNGIHDRLSLLENPPTPEPDQAISTPEAVTEVQGENEVGLRESHEKPRFRIF